MTHAGGKCDDVPSPDRFAPALAKPFDCAAGDHRIVRECMVVQWQLVAGFFEDVDIIALGEWNQARDRHDQDAIVVVPVDFPVVAAFAAGLGTEVCGAVRFACAASSVATAAIAASP